MDRHRISTENAPPALGPYSQAIVANGFVFCSGTVGVDPHTGALPEGIAAQTEQALLNLAAILEAGGSSLDRLVKTTIFYANVEDFATINEVYARHMPDPPPARSAPANVALPRGLLISIEAIATLEGEREGRLDESYCRRTGNGVSRSMGRVRPRRHHRPAFCRNSVSPARSCG